MSEPAQLRPSSSEERMERLASLALKLDGLVNVMTGIGDAAKDKRLQAEWVAESVTQEQLEAMYRESDMAAAIVEVPVDEEFRRGFDVRIGADEGAADDAQEVAEAVLNLVDERDFLPRIQEARYWARAYGGSGLLVGADDTLELDMPLNETAVERFQSLTALTPDELRPIEWDVDLKSRRFGEPVLYEVRPIQYSSAAANLPGRPRVRALSIAPETVLVHHTRIIRFDGVSVSRRMKRTNDMGGWGDSVLVRPRGLIRDFEAAWQSAALSLQDFSQALLKIKGLLDINEEEDAAKVLFARMAAFQAGRSRNNLAMIDSEEEFSFVGQPVTGLADLLQQMAIRVAAAARIPVTLLMGQAPAGLNATGDSDIRNFYARVKASQMKSLRPGLNRVIQLLFRSKDGPTKGVEPETWHIEFKPLWQPTDTEQGDIRLKQAQTDQIYILQGVLSPEEVAISRFSGPSYSTETFIDPKSRSDITPEDSDAPPGVPTGGAGGLPGAGVFPQARAQAQNEDSSRVT